MLRRLPVLMLLLAGGYLAGCESPTENVFQAPLQLSVVSGDGQTGSPGELLADPLVVKVEDSRGHGVRGQIVNFRVVEGGGTVFAGAAITNKDGIAQERWTLGPSGAQTVEARAVDTETGEALTFAVFTATLLDDAGPEVSEVVATPNPATTEQEVSLTALVDDAATGGSNLTGAEYSINGGAFVGMAAQDGAFDTPTEAVRVTISALAAPGDYQLCVRGTDAPGNVGSAACVTLTVEQAAATAVYVSKLGNDWNAGTMNAPLLTIGAGIAAAQAGGFDRVNVGLGTYAEHIALVSGVSLFGGYNHSDWTRDPQAYVTHLVGSTSGVPTVLGTSVANVTIDGVEIEGAAGQAPSASSYALILEASTAVVISNNRILSRAGANGSQGAQGGQGWPGNAGAAGVPGDPDGPHGNGGAGGLGQCGPSVSGGSGGRGGLEGNNQGQRGFDGVGPAGGGSGGVGGQGSQGGVNPFQQGLPGAIGSSGGSGSDGQNGSGGSNFGDIVAARYAPAHGVDGADGQPGAGGGGGGGGGGQGGTFVVDGGGNGGGGGAPGRGGGGSFAVLLYNSSSIVVTDNAITTGNGGAGGQGGGGGQGGAGGQGAPGATAATDEIGAGGNGGDGGAGGHGGIGGGGGGGPSIGILAVGGAPTASGNVFTLGLAGAGGNGAVAGLRTSTHIIP